MSKYLYATVYEEFTGLKPPEPTDNKQRRKRGYGHPYRMRLNMQDETENKPKKPERRNQFGQPITARKNRDESYRKPHDMDYAPQFNAGRTIQDNHDRKSHANSYQANRTTDHQGSAPLLATPQERKSSSATPKVTYKKRRAFDTPDGDGSNKS